MILYPAIDIKDGRVVRLLQGKFDEMTEYSGDPVVVAQNWIDKGAQWLHVVDLDGALKGQTQNSAVILKIAKSVSVPVQTGGGLRDRETIESYLNGGVNRVILGTKVVEDRAFLKTMVERWGERIAVSLDCKDGYVAQRGWTETSDIKAVDVAKELESIGVARIIYTDIARDGMLTGPNFDGLETMLKATRIPVIASGGIANIEDIRRLKSLEQLGVEGAITGKALYEGKLNLEEALAAC